VDRSFLFRTPLSSSLLLPSTANPPQIRSPVPVYVFTLSDASWITSQSDQPISFREPPGHLRTTRSFRPPIHRVRIPRSFHFIKSTYPSFFLSTVSRYIVFLFKPAQPHPTQIKPIPSLLRVTACPFLPFPCPPCRVTSSKLSPKLIKRRPKKRRPTPRRVPPFNYISLPLSNLLRSPAHIPLQRDRSAHRQPA